MVTRRRADSKPKLLILHNRAGRAAAADHAPDPAEGVDAALEHLRALAAGLGESGFEVALVDAEDDTQRVTHAVVVEQPALVFLVDHFDGAVLRHPGVANLLELHGLTYTGSDPLCLATCLDRVRTYLLLSDAEVPVPAHAVVRDINAIPDTAAIEPPMLIGHALDHDVDDPDRRSLVHSRAEMEERAGALAAGPGLPILIERFIEGRRVQAVVLGNRVLEVLPLSERLAGDDGRLGPARLAQLEVDTADTIRALAQRAFRVMGCRDCAQVELALDREGRPLVLDVRPVFDMFPDSPFVVGASASELGVAGAVARLADIALERLETAPAEPPTLPLAAVIDPLPDLPPPERLTPADPPVDPPAAAAVPAPDQGPKPPARPKPPTPRRRPASRARPGSATLSPAPADRDGDPDDPSGPSGPTGGAGGKKPRSKK